MDMYEILGEKKQTIKNYLSRHFEMEKDILDGVFKDSVTILAFDRGAIDLAGFQKLVSRFGETKLQILLLEGDEDWLYEVSLDDVESFMLKETFVCEKTFVFSRNAGIFLAYSYEYWFSVIGIEIESDVDSARDLISETMDVVPKEIAIKEIAAEIGFNSGSEKQRFIRKLDDGYPLSV